MAYFSLPALTLPSYRFDFHQRFDAMVPVEDAAAVATQALQLQVPLARAGAADASVQIAQGQQLSLTGAFGGAAGAGQGRRGTLSLFLKALAWMEERNPLAMLAASADRQRYEPGECVAENIYLACVCLTPRLGLTGLDDAAATDPVFYKSVRGALQSLDRASAKTGADDTLAPLLPLLSDFNRKIYSADRFTPIDDACRARAFALSRLRAEPDGEQRYLQWLTIGLMYLQRQGIAHAQIAVDEDDVRIANAVVTAYNAQQGSQYKLLVSTQAMYAGSPAFPRDLSARLLPLFEDAGLSEVIGIDLRGHDHEPDRYAGWLAFLGAQTGQPGQPTPSLTRLFGSAAGARALQFVNHIECGEGTGLAADNRSAIGYAMAYSKRLPGPEFYRAYADYTLTCLAAAHAGQAGAASGRAGEAWGRGLFDELFRNDSLTFDGLTLRRYDGDSARSREQIDRGGKRGTMALCEALDLPASPPQAGAAAPPSYYEALTAPSSGLSFRLGHAYWYRAFFAARYPAFAFDTCLGSNAVAAASGLLASAEGYRLDPGSHPLYGYVDTDTLTAVSDAMMPAGWQALDPAQTGALIQLARNAASPAAMLQAGQATIEPMLAAAMAPIYPTLDAQSGYQAFSTVVAAMIGDSPSRSVWFAALVRGLNLLLNWRCYLLCSDTQGPEYAGIQDEFLRSVLVLIYQLVPFDSSPGAQVAVTNALQQLVADIASAYWRSTIGPLAGLSGGPQITATIAGCKAPASVVTVMRGKAPA